MGSVKPFIIGSILGAGFAFVALQYHVVQSKDGFSVVPRTPQHSLGLAYADVRHWDAEQWADRPELAKALIANGATDIVTGGIAGELANSVLPEGGGLGQLSDFLNDSSSDSTEPKSLFDSSEFMTIPKDADADNEANDELKDLFTVPFQRDAGNRSGNSVSQNEPLRRPEVAQREKPLIDDVFNSGGRDDSSGTLLPRARAEETSIRSRIPQDSGVDTAHETNLLRGMLFGDDDTASSENAEQVGSGQFGTFEDITSTLENRAEEAIDQARSGVQAQTQRAYRGSVDSAKRFVREKVTKGLPDSFSGMFSDDLGATSSSQGAYQPAEGNLPPSLKAIRDGFDPFVD